MLKNAPTLAIGGVDTEENEHCKVCPLSVYRSPRCSDTTVAGQRVGAFFVSRKFKRSKPRPLSLLAETLKPSLHERSSVFFIARVNFARGAE